jgi:hypothetical protein
LYLLRDQTTFLHQVDNRNPINHQQDVNTQGQIGEVSRGKKAFVLFLFYASQGKGDIPKHRYMTDFDKKDYLHALLPVD